MAFLEEQHCAIMGELSRELAPVFWVYHSIAEATVNQVVSKRFVKTSRNGELSGTVVLTQELMAHLIIDGLRKC